MARYIDADRFRDRVKTQVNPYGKPTLEYESGLKVLTMIDNEPTADVVEVKQGEWVHTDEDGTWKCSLCGGEIVADAYGDIHPLDDCGWIGCPYCLARMDGTPQKKG